MPKKAKMLGRNKRTIYNCKHCGCMAEVLKGTDIRWFYVCCTNCQHETPWCNTAKKAIEIWNDKYGIPLVLPEEKKPVVEEPSSVTVTIPTQGILDRLAMECPQGFHLHDARFEFLDNVPYLIYLEVRQNGGSEDERYGFLAKAETGDHVIVKDSNFDEVSIFSDNCMEAMFFVTREVQNALSESEKAYERKNDDVHG